MCDGVLLRKWIPHKYFVGDPVFQVVVPVKFRHMMIEVVHDKSGHQGVRKTYDRLLRHFFWPQMATCQLTSKPKQVLKSVPLKPLPATGEPFEHLVDQCRPTAERCICEPGDQALVLRPVVSSPFEARFDGPFVVQCNYEIIPHGKNQLNDTM